MVKPAEEAGEGTVPLAVVKEASQGSEEVMEKKARGSEMNTRDERRRESEKL
jgi:hypothetical protein